MSTPDPTREAAVQIVERVLDETSVGRQMTAIAVVDALIRAGLPPTRETTDDH